MTGFRTNPGFYGIQILKEIKKNFYYACIIEQCSNKKKIKLINTQIFYMYNVEEECYDPGLNRRGTIKTLAPCSKQQ